MLLQSINLPVALPPVTKTMTIVSVGRRALRGSMVIITGTATSSVVEPFVASSPVLETCPNLNWKAAEKQQEKKKKKKKKNIPLHG